MTTRVLIQTAIEIQFSDEGRAKEYFLEGAWAKSNPQLKDLNAVQEHLAELFLSKEEFWGEKALHHFGVFKQQDNGVWLSHNAEYGTIALRVNTDKCSNELIRIADFYPTWP